LTELKICYLLWHSFLIDLPRLTRYTLGVKIDNLFTELLGITIAAQYTKRTDKLEFLEELNRKFDNLKYFITILWEAKGLSAGKYAQLSQKLTRIGQMLGGWIALLKRNSPN